MNMTKERMTVSPTAPVERIVALDVLRGFALLGILIINIQLFSMIDAAYLNPSSFGDLTGINGWVWKLSHVFADQKFMTIFSILYGAGILLFTGKAESKGIKPAGLHYRRTFWLVIFGLLHAYCLWYGDILVAYALCAAWVYLMRKKSPKTLFIVGLVLISTPALLSLMGWWSMSYWDPDLLRQAALSWKPNADMIADEIAAYRGGWLDQMAHRIPTAIESQTVVFFFWAFWRVSGLMLIGMAFFKWGILTAQRSKAFYTRMLVLCFCIGLPVVIYGAVRCFAAGWSYEYTMFLGRLYNYWGSLFVSSGYIALIMLLSKSDAFLKRVRPLAAYGRMALTHYLLQTLICTTIFYGHGFGLFGKVQRIGQLFIVFGVWIIQLIVSPVWFNYFRFGPAEWLWRSLCYSKFQPMRRIEPAESA